MPLRSRRQSLLTTLAPLVDGLLVGLAGWLAYFTRWDKWSMSLEYLAVLVLGTGLVLVILPATGAYRTWRDEWYWRNTGNTLPGLFLVAALLTIAGTLTKTTADYSRLWMAYWFGYSVCALLLFRWLSASLTRLLLLGQAKPIRVLIVGEGAFAQSVAQKARDAQDSNWEIVGIISPFDANLRVANSDSTAVSLQEMEALVSDPGSGIEEIWIAMDHTGMHKQEAVIRVLQSSCLTVRYVPDLSMITLLNHVPSEVAGMTVINLNASPLTGHNTLIKAAVDKLIAIAALLVLAPLLIVIAALVKLDSAGPVFFRQNRHGWDGRVIQILKFRTMRHVLPMPDDAKQARPNDPRITRVGRFLRKTSLDELPQFINVLRGDMSVVGPRPHPLALNRSYAGRIDAYMQRHRVKPGITGWAQVHGLRGETETLEKMQRRVEYDLYYIEHWSLWLDFRIIILTLVAGWGGNNAY
jgi:putative colanic acid biosynthesis UDP-glucose lipid carrier transferase